MLPTINGYKFTIITVVSDIQSGPVICSKPITLLSVKKEKNNQSRLPLKEKSAIPYVLPIKRSDSTAFIKLRRAATVAATKMIPPTPSLVARDHWINARLRDREDKFVTWETAK